VTDGAEYGGEGLDHEPGVLDRVRSFFDRGLEHDAHLAGADIRVSVSGIRGKSSTAKQLGAILHERGYDTYTKITGDHPTSIHNGVTSPIQRVGPRVTLYENIHLVKEFVPQLAAEDGLDAVVMENQAITEYTMRMVNERFLQPDVVVWCNVRQDHNDTLGKDRQTIAQSFARSIPAGTHVINGEQHDAIHDYMAREVAKRDGTIEQVELPDEHRDRIGAETVHALNHVLAYYDEPPLSDVRVQSMLDAIQPEWTRLPGGRVFNGAKVNEIESTELFRRELAGTGDDAETVLPFVFLRRDRRGRTASFVEYVNLLADRGLIDACHVGGAYTGVFAGNVDCPAVEHDTADPDDAPVVLDALLDVGQPVVFMANTVDPFMRTLVAEVDRRAAGGELSLPEY